MAPRILAVNPGSTTTKAALFDGQTLIKEVEIQHSREELAAFPSVMDQKDFRRRAVEEVFCDQALFEGLQAVAGRGGLLAPMPGGVYRVNARMLDDLADAKFGEHPCNLGAFLAAEIASERGCQAFIVDPVVTDEMDAIARLTGLPEISRRSVLHALNQRGAARKAAQTLGVTYEDENFIVAHLGGGISIGAHRRGRVVDVINGLDGEGPFTPERSGGLPLLPVLALLEKSAHSPKTLRKKVLTGAGLFAHLGTNDLRRVEEMIKAGDAHAAAVFAALAYNIAKCASSMGPALFSGPTGSQGLRAVVLTGGMAKSERLVGEIAARISFLAPVQTVTGVEELEVLADGALRVLEGRTFPGEYAGER